jgi:hypothetical protein
MNYLKIAHSINPDHPLLLLLLAEHYLYANQPKLAKKYAKKGLGVIKEMPRLNSKEERDRDDYY